MTATQIDESQVDERQVDANDPVALLRFLHGWITEQEKLPYDSPLREWYQSMWALNPDVRKHDLVEFWGMSERDANVCGTAYCAFGKVATMAGGWFTWHGRGEDPVLHDLPWDNAYQAGRALLGLSDQDAMILSAGDNTADQMRWIIEGILARCYGVGVEE
jgi:hypothetical protein